MLKSRLPVELELEEAIKNVFEEIVDRKVQSLAAGNSNNVSKGQGQERNWQIDVPAAGGITGLGLQHFSDNDRLSAIATFVAKPDVFAKLTAILGADLQV